MQGKLITSEQINSNTTFNVDGATGVYIVTTKDAKNGIVISKVVL